MAYARSIAKRENEFRRISFDEAAPGEDPLDRGVLISFVVQRSFPAAE